MTTDAALDDLAAALGVAGLTGDEQRLLLDCARDVAHLTQRRFAPLSTFLLGVAVGAAADRPTALADAVSAIRAALPTETAQDPPAG